MVEAKVKGTTIWVPMEFKTRVIELSKRYKKPQWKLLLEALSLYEAQLRKPKVKEDLPIVDKVVWYMQKLGMSVGILKANPTDENMQKTLNTIAQVRDRLGIDTGVLERAVNDYVTINKRNFKNGSVKHDQIDEATMELNMALKSVLMEMMYKHILKEEGGD
jgi:hypothetical protein